MAQTREIAQEREEFFREAMEWKSPYELWKESQSLPTIRGLGVHGLYDDDFELFPWKERGGSGVFINLDGTGGFNDTYVHEIPARESSVPGSRLYSASYSATWKLPGPRAPSAASSPATPKATRA